MASAIINSAKHCLHTQVMLDNLAATPAGRFESSGMIEALKSAQNKRGYEQITNSVEESKRRAVAGQAPPTVEVKIRKPSCEAAGTSAIDLCTETDASAHPYEYIEPAVTKVANRSLTYTEAEFDNLCESGDERHAAILQDFASEILNDMGIVLAQDAWAILGNYFDGTSSTGATTLDLPIISASGTLQSAAFARIASEFRQQGFKGRPIMVGGEKLAMGMDVLRLGGTGTSLNLDPNAAFSSTSSFYDYNLDATINTLQSTAAASYAITWTPGALQMLEWYRNTGSFQKFREDYTETTLMINGYKFDYFVNYDKCTHLYTVGLQKHYGLFWLPDALYTCNEGTGKVLWELTCGTMDCTTLGPTPS